ncbi:MAG: ion channel [Aeromicrobium sp.]|uniref:potassium channel family protein n=1 Tax=Aeromicrobium sp. TaxID=1871063 RepID=UPI0025BFD296|nr:potassium channel family protein [Aeromicrobium sp.]MCK5890521.1 potassium channel family protein [Aeromicrobium sp.]MDF1703505.1 ion channel [Aeromicrobium sp.]
MTLARWERLSSAPLAAATLAFLVAYAWPILDLSLDARLRGLCNAVVVVTWVAFGLDVLLRLSLATDRRRWLKQHPIDVLAVALPVLRPLQLLRVLALITTLNRFASTNLRGRVGLYLGGSIVVLTFVSAVAVLDAERGSDGTIQTFGDALWWAFATLTTVGYGDVFPVTTTGRVVAVALMMSGIAALGVVTASIATWLIDQVSDESKDAQAATQEDVTELRAEVARLTAAIEQLAGRAPYDDEPER